MAHLNSISNRLHIIKGCMKKIGFLLLMAWFSSEIYAETVVLNANESPPYWSKKLPHYGLGGEIIEAMSQAVEIESLIEFMPLKRLIDDTHNNDLGNPAFYMENQEFAAIIPIAVSQVSLYSFNHLQRKLPIQFKSISDLKGYRIGALSGSVTDKSGLEKMGIHLEMSYSQESLFKKLHYGRLDFVLEIDLIGQQMIKKLFPTEEQHFIAVPIPRSISPIAVMLDKNYPNANMIAQRYRQGLAQIIKSGQYSDIIAKYSQQKPSAIWFKELQRFTQLYKTQRD